jgi:hypothetical protein
MQKTMKGHRNRRAKLIAAVVDGDEDCYVRLQDPSHDRDPATMTTGWRFHRGDDDNGALYLRSIFKYIFIIHLSI